MKAFIQRWKQKAAKRCGCARRAAFTLVELAIALVGVSLMLGLGLQLAPKETSDKCYAETRAELADMKNALTKFAQTHKRFPKPAADTSGVEATAVGGVMTQSTDLKAYIGYFPYATVGLSANYATDCFNNGADSNYRYVVAERLTGITNYKANKGIGNLEIQTSSGGGVSSGAKKAFAVISHGKSGSCKGLTTPPNCAPTSSVLHDYPFTLTASGANYFDQVVLISPNSFQSCSGKVHWNGVPGVTDPNAVTEPCFATIPDSDPLHVGEVVTMATSSPNNVGSATITCEEPDGSTRPNGLVATGTCDCKAGQGVYWKHNDTTAYPVGTPGVCEDVTMKNITQGAGSDQTETLNDTTSAYTGAATAQCTTGNLTLSSSPMPTCGCAVPSTLGVAGDFLAEGATIPAAYHPDRCDRISITCTGGTLSYGNRMARDAANNYTVNTGIPGDATYNRSTPTTCTQYYLGWAVGHMANGGVHALTNTWASCNVAPEAWPNHLGAPGCFTGVMAPTILWNAAKLAYCPWGDYSKPPLGTPSYPAFAGYPLPGSDSQTCLSYHAEPSVVSSYSTTTNVTLPNGTVFTYADHSGVSLTPNTTTPGSLTFTDPGLDLRVRCFSQTTPLNCAAAPPSIP